MAGLIKDEDIATVRERARIDEIVSEHVTLRNAGGGSMKGLCPFHDEKTPSFHVTPSRGYYHCFGCQAGGDVIKFVMEVEGLGFADAVERLADKVGIQLRYTEGDAPGPRRDPGQRARLIEAHKLAQEFYADQLATPDAMVARMFLSDRGFDRDAAETFGLGFAPRSGEALVHHLRQKGFRDDELITGGLASQGRSAYDRFRGRLLWPIRETNGDTIGFGARRIFDDDRIDAKYLNTSETPIYKKSSVLYGVDLARKEIARTSQAVVVEGYTDVMACHLSGVGTAVASCGTAFGEEHGRVLRRLLHDHEDFRGEIIFTFDGDEAGQKAAMKAFEGDQQFASQTYVAVEPEGMDPCDLRLAKGDAAVRELVARRVPLYRFVLANLVQGFDLDRADGRVDALRRAARLVSSVRDRSKVDAFARELAGMVGVDIEEARREVRRAVARGPEQVETRRGRGPVEDEPAPPAPRPDVPDPRDPRFAVERETLKLVVQHPAAVGTTAADLTADDFAHPHYRAIWAAVASAGGPAAATSPETWPSTLAAALPDPSASPVLGALAVEPLRSLREPNSDYVAAHVYGLQEVTTQRRIADLKSRLQRTNPVDQATDYNKMFGDLVALEQHRRTLREKAVGGE